MDPEAFVDAGVPHGELLLRFASAAQLGSPDLGATRAALGAAVGPDGLIEAAATIAIFNGLVRVADGTGIQLDNGTLADSADYRDRLGVDTFGGAANVELSVAANRGYSVADFFG